MPSHSDPRRPDRVRRYQPSKETDSSFPAEHINAVGMVCSLLGLIIRLKWAAWIGVYCSLIYLANSRYSDDKKQTLSLFIDYYKQGRITNVPPQRLATSSLVMVYMQNPAPMALAFG